MYSLRLLGGFALIDPAGEKVRRLPQRRGEAVLALLAISRELGCSRDRLIAMLWPESSDALARHSLRDVLYGVRQAVHPEVLVSSGDTVTLNPAIVSTDVGRFAACREAERLAEAVQAYRGPFLDGFHVDDAPDFEHWCEDERTRLFRECAEMLEALAVQAEHGADWPAAAAWWLRATEHDPHNSRLVLCLMNALVASGDRANALLRAEAHRRRLWTELEITPDPEFELAVANLRNGNGVAATAGSPTGGPRHATSRVAAHNGSSARGVPAEAPTAASVDQPPLREPAPDNAGIASGRAPARPKWLRFGILFVPVVAMAIAIGVLVGRSRTARHADPDRDVVAVVPFFSSGHGSLRVMAAELYGEMMREVSDDLAPHPVDSVITRRAWEEASSAGAPLDPRAVDEGVSARTKAALVLSGTIDSTVSGPSLTLTLVRFPWRTVVAQRTATLGDTAIADARRLLIEVLALEAGEPEHRLGELSQHATRPVRLYLDNIRKIRPHQRRMETLRQVWALDSSLLYPGLFAFHPSGFTPEVGPREDSVARAVWRRRASLVPEDRAFANALIGPWLGLADDAQQRIELWRLAAEAAPAWWLPSALYANEVLSYGARASVRSWPDAARQAMMAALEQTHWTMRPLVEMAFWHGVFFNDSVLSRRALDARVNLREAIVVPGFRHFWYFWSDSNDWPWLYEAAFRSNGRTVPRPDTMTPQRINQAFRSLRVLALARPRAAIHADSFAARWERTLAGKPPQGMEWWVGFHWRTRGEYARWQDAQLRDYRFGWGRGALFNELADDVLFMRDAIHFGVPADTAVKLAILRMQRIVNGDSVPAPPIRAKGIAACWLSQWRLSRGDTTGVDAAIALLHFLDAEDRAGRQDGLPGSSRWTVCPTLLEAERARVIGRDALAKARALDQLLRPMPTPRRSWWSFAGNLGHDLIRPFAENLLSARLLAAAGDTAGALAAARRRPQGAAFQLDFFDHQTDHLRLEGLMAAAMADTLAAVAAYEEYLALRSNRPAYPPWRAEWDSVRTELARLKPQR